MSFPRLSVSGTLILTIYIVIMKVFFYKSFYGASLQSGAMLSSSTILNGSTMAASFLNVMSHSAVVLGAFNDTYVLSIIVGVGFDVFTRILQLIWWIHITMISFESRSEKRGLMDDVFTTSYLFILAIIYVYHMIIHLRALRMNSSYQRLKKVLSGALNNLRGIPGERFHDHFFAYSDLGAHLCPLGLSTILLKRQESLHTCFLMIALQLILSSLALSKVPINKLKIGGEIVQLKEDGKIVCNCNTCLRRTKRRSRTSSFTFNMNDGICALWLYSFENLSDVLCSSFSQKKQ